MRDLLPMLAVVGPTASGKSAVALEVAARAGGEIVSCDSVQVYRGFEIGAAKPTKEERRRVRHHLLDVADWDEPFDAARYRSLATAAIADVRGRGKIPVLCGGTGLYLRALRWGLVQTPPADPGLRERLEAEEEASRGSLYARLRRVDPDTAARTEPNNLVHVIRALEIHALTGKPASEVRAHHGFAREQIPMRVVCIWWQGEPLRARIAQRTEAMLDAGLVDEVREHLSRGVSPTCRPLSAVGYREVVDVLEGHTPADELAARISRATWHYARRQRTWFRKERDLEVLEVGHPTDLAAVSERLYGQINP